MTRLSTRTLRLAYVIEVAIVAGPPIGLLAMQWALALYAVLVPETTCWLAAVDGKFFFSTEVPILFFYTGVAIWLPISIITTGISYFWFGPGFGRWLVIWTALGALASIVLLYFGTSLAVSLESDAFAAIRQDC